MELLKNKTAVITGCHRGIGKAILEKFVSYGCNVCCINRCEDLEFSEYCKNLAEVNNVEVKILYADFSVEDEVKAAASRLVKEKVNADILINNVGIANPLNMFTMTKMESIRQAFEINLFSAISLSQTVSRMMMRKRAGSIVFVSSSAAFDGGANIEYSASKAAIIGAARRMAIELGQYGIRVNTIAPGLTATDMGNSMSEEDEAIALSRNIMRRKGCPDEIADAVVFMASDLSRFITGQVLRVDGGLLK